MTGAPAVARQPDLLSLVGRDLFGCRLDRTSGASAVVTAEDGTTFDLEIRVDRRKLMTLQISTVSVRGVPTAATGRVVLRHTGRLRRTGLEAVSRDHASNHTHAMAEHLLHDGTLEQASLPLDFTSFVVEPHEGCWRARMELMGGSHVKIVLPPTRSYVRLAADQRDALLATAAVLRRLLEGVPQH